MRKSDPGRNLRTPVARPLLCAITDGSSLPERDLLSFIRSAIEAGIDLIQIRERYVPPRELLRITREAVALSRDSTIKILINDRLDVALAAGADGVHLPVHGLPIDQVRRRYPDLLVGTSVHNLTELRHAEQAGTDYAVFGPVFSPLSKTDARSPVGLKTLGEATASVSIPVLALGGVTEENADSCLAVGAAGVAGITLFQRCPNLDGMVARLRRTAGNYLS